MADYAIHEETLVAQANILRKKFGTAELQDPADYADKMNLMGLLEEKTATGSIVTFSDGADDVPLKSCEVALPASLDGYSSVDVVQTGKNLFDKNAVEQHTWIIVDSTETETRSNINYLTSDYIPVKANTRYSVSAKASNRAAYYDRNKNGISYFSFSGGASFNSLYEGYIRLTIKDDTDLDAFIVNEGNEAIAYEPFGATHTASLGRTIYGGTPDVVKGEGRETHGNTSLADKKYYYSSALQRFDCALDGVISSGYADDFIPPQGYTINHALIIDGANAPDYTMCIFGGKLYIKNLSCSSVEELVNDMSGKYLTYPLASPTDFTFEPVEISSRLGNNTMWSDGDMEVVYRSIGTMTPIQPTLISKTITENGTYSASDDGADGYDAVVVNVPTIQSIAVHSGKLNIKNGTITEDADYCYTDEIECPNGWMRMDFGETSNGDFIGIEMLDNGTHNNYWVANSRFRSIDLSSNYSASKTIRLAFRKTYADVVVYIDYSNSKLYSPFTMLKMQEASAPSLLSMTPSEEVNENTEEVEENEQNDIEG